MEQTALDDLYPFYQKELRYKKKTMIVAGSSNSSP
jgi:hypothetical protein